MALKQSVHLVGSVPLNTARDVFRTSTHILGKRLKRVPDGETGERKNWIGWQLPKIAASEGLQLYDQPDKDYGRIELVRIAEGCQDSVQIQDLGYFDAAMTSYAVFAQAKAEGSIDSACRFQVCLPTPLAPIQLYVQKGDQALLEPVYEAALSAELAEIITEIPAEELAIQWDTAVEFGVLEGVFPSYLEAPFEDIIARLVRLGERVPQGVELGYHLCYGDSGHKHFVEPNDMSKLVAVANRLTDDLSRQVNWIHMPVPRGRDDAAYFQPLEGLLLPPATEVYLGLIHATDGTSGAARRIESAQKFLAEFGIATECGLGRRNPDSIPGLLALHADVADSQG
jgi:hypothetical protein